MRTALSAVRRLIALGWTIPNDAIVRGFANVRRNTGLRGRWETLATSPLTIVDVAHNADGIDAINQLLKETPHGNLHIVLGMVGDKDIHLVLMRMPKAATYYFCKADIPRGLAAGLLREAAHAHGLNGSAHPSVVEALRSAREEAAADDLVLVTGSVFVVAEVV